MPAPSIFDCDNSTTELSNNFKRVQIAYDDDIFEFGDTVPTDLTDIVQNVPVSKNEQPQKKSKPFGKRASDTNLAPPSKFPRFEETVDRTVNVRKEVVIRPKAPLGTNSADKYKLLNMIGKGTYGRVYRAQMLGTKTVVAVKRIIIENNKDDKYMQFVGREKEHLKALSGSRNVMQILDSRKERIGYEAHQIDLVLEFCPFDLSKIIAKRNIRFELADVKAILRDILNGINAMHEKMIMHRDIKTENILLTANGIAKVGDLGLARVFDDPITCSFNPQYSLNVVTLWYRAPEILLGDTQYTSQIDLWSVGCIMGEFWARRPILQGKTDYDQLKLISELCGTIDVEAWPNLATLRLFQNFKLPGPFERRTRSYLARTMENEEAKDFFDSLMVYNPEKRLNAWTALNDTFFYTEPLPSEDLRAFLERITPWMTSASTSTSTSTSIQ